MVQILLFLLFHLYPASIYYCIIFPFLNHCACGWVKKMMVELLMIYKIWHVNDSYFVVSQDITSTFPSRLEIFFSPINFWVETTILYKMLTWSINILLYLCEKDMPWKFGTIYYLGLTLLFGDLAKVRCTYYWHIYFCWSKIFIQFIFCKRIFTFVIQSCLNRSTLFQLFVYIHFDTFWF